MRVCPLRKTGQGDGDLLSPLDAWGHGAKRKSCAPRRATNARQSICLAERCNSLGMASGARIQGPRGRRQSRLIGASNPLAKIWGGSKPVPTSWKPVSPAASAETLIVWEAGPPAEGSKR
jgi:hypothetical protein